MTKAENLLGGELVELTKHSKVYSVEDMERLQSALDADSSKAIKADVTTLVAIFLQKAGVKKPPTGSSEEREFVTYALGLSEAFGEFPASVGWLAIHGGTGVLATLEFRPKPSDVMKFCNDVMGRRTRARVMAKRHIAEAKRRAEDREIPPPTDEQKKRAAEKVAQFKRELAKAVSDDDRNERLRRDAAIARRRAVRDDLELSKALDA